MLELLHLCSCSAAICWILLSPKEHPKLSGVTLILQSTVQPLSEGVFFYSLNLQRHSQ